MKNPLGKSWQTTLAGILTGIASTSTIGWMDPDGSPNLGSILVGIGIAAMGALAKQHNVTGGTVPTTPEAETRVEGTTKENP